tara:strand:+ start:275 stop:733 length:459 start_codon:yes stop_codon:yes gene_type:complete
MALAAHEIILRTSSAVSTPFVTDYSTAEAAGTDMAGAKDVTLSNSADILDTTAFDDSTSFRTKLSGLKDASMSFSANFEAGTGDGSVKDIFDALSGGETRHYFIGLTGAGATTEAGFAASGVIESVEITGAVDGLVEASISVQLSGAPEFLS